MSQSRTFVYHSSAFLGHDTGNHVERAARIAAIDRELDRRALLTNRPQVDVTPVDDEAILRVHTPAHLANLERWTAEGGGWIDGDTVLREDSLALARLAAGGAVSSVIAVLEGTIDRAFVVARPPGHHATPDRAMGFCLLNTVAIAAAAARAQGAARVAVIDWDVHHGNGTQDIFYGRSDVLYASLHQWPLFPGTGSATETGTGDGVGYTLNCPLPAGTDDTGFLAALDDAILPAIAAFRPSIILVSAGYDASTNDPIGGMLVSREGFTSAMERTVAVAESTCEGRIVAVLEGGYDPPTLATCVADAIQALDGDADPENHPFADP